MWIVSGSVSRLNADEQVTWREARAPGQLEPAFVLLN